VTREKKDRLASYPVRLGKALRARQEQPELQVRQFPAKTGKKERQVLFPALRERLLSDNPARPDSQKKVKRGFLVFRLQVLQEFRVASVLRASVKKERKGFREFQRRDLKVVKVFKVRLDSERKAKKALQDLLVSEHPEQLELQALPERGFRVLRDILKTARRVLLEFRGLQLPLAPVSLILLRNRTPPDLLLSRRVSMP
jgi:hypothetical protein